VIVPVTGDDQMMDSAVVLLDRNRLYLRRFWRYEVEVARMVLSRSVPVEPGSRTTPPDKEVGTSARTTAVEGETGTAGGNAPDLDGSASDEIIVQDQAVQAGLAYRFAVITGGPGTGKTYSVLLLLTAMLQRDPSLRIVLCAPTGKAAARMMESIHGSLARLNPPEQVRAGIPESASTIHRLIRWNPSLGKSVYDAQNPLPYDVVILDEASMVDVALMSRLARALRADTRLILLGDKDQLSSVEAGSVFADIAARDVPNVVRLTRSWRFSADSEIGRLARVINAGDGEGSWAMLLAGDQVGFLLRQNPAESGQPSEELGQTSSAPGQSSSELGQTPAELGQTSSEPLQAQSEPGTSPAISDTPETAAPDVFSAFRPETSNTSHRQGLYRILSQRVTAHHAAFSAEADDYRALRQLSQFQILAALRVGPYGADQLNVELDRRIGGGAVWYAGRPVIATANNYDLDVFNGDVGLTRMIDGRLMVAFEGSAPGSVRWIAPAQLKSVSSAWALTVHKSQGSEYDDVIFILPDRHAPVLSRELAYTALTRARHRFQVWGSGSIWRQMLAARVERYSGLADRLAHDPETI